MILGGTILLVIGILCLIFADCWDSFFLIVAGIILLFVGILTIGCGIDEHKVEQAKKCEVWYLDGEEIDKEKYDISLYNFTYDEEKGVAYLTRKR